MKSFPKNGFENCIKICTYTWATSLSLFTFMHWRRIWQPTPVFLPGESQGRGSLVGWRLWGQTESDTTEVTQQQQQQQHIHMIYVFYLYQPLTNLPIHRADISLPFIKNVKCLLNIYIYIFFFLRKKYHY